MSDPHPSQIQQDNKLPIRLPSLKVLKLLAIGLVLIFGFVVLGFRVLNAVSIKGVVNAPILLLQAPIDGTITEDNVKAGDTVLPNTVLFRMEDQLINTTNLHHIESQLQKSKANLMGFERQLSEYGALREDLNNRLNAHVVSQTIHASHLLEEERHFLKQAQVELAQYDRDMERQELLSKKGVDSKKDLELSILNRQTKLHEIDGSKARIGRLENELEAVKNGVLLDGYSGAPYTQQRLDEVTLRYSELLGSIASEKETITALEKQLRHEQDIVAKLAVASITAPSLSLVQSVRVSKGNYVTRGTVICELVDVSKSYIEATIPEKQFDKVKIGDKATVYLYGNRKPIEGLVISMRGAGAFNTSNPEQFAAKVVKTTPDSMLVNIAITSDDVERLFGSINQVGRTARVVLRGSR